MRVTRLPGPTTPAYSANRESSLDRDSLLVSIPSRTGDPQRPCPFPAHLCDPLPGRLRSSPPPCRLRTPPQATSPRYPASVGRAGLPVLGQFSHLPRSRRGGPHVARRPAFVRNPVAATGGFEIGRCPATRSGQRQETTHCTASRRNHGGAAKLPSSGTAPDQLPVS